MATLALNACGGDGGESGSDPKIRLLNLSTGYPSLDMMTNLDSDEDDDDETQADGVALEAVSEYATIDPDDYTVKVRRTGSGSVLRSFSGEELVEDTINTYVAYGEVGKFGALRIDDTLDEADAGETKLSVANVSSAGTLDIYLTDANTDLDDTTPVLSSVGAQLTSLSTDSGTYRLRVTAAGDSADVRLDVANFALTDRGVASLILTSTQGGMLANAVMLPQEGQPTKIANTKARVRGAVALANGANATIQVGGQSVADLGDRGRDRQPLHLARRRLRAGDADREWRRGGGAQCRRWHAGADYTLLVWSNAGGAQTSLIVDDNRLPSGGTTVTKLRLLNGMSTLAAPLTLSVDFSPVIEGTLLGPGVGRGGNRRRYRPAVRRRQHVDRRRTCSLAAAITLQGNSVYTFFMTDNGATAIGVLRRDR